MARRSTVMGFTEAELGFVLAALFVALAGFQANHAITSSGKAAQANAVSDTLRKELERLRAENDSLRGRTSRLTPPCSERGEKAGSIAAALVTGANTIEVQGMTLEPGDLRDHLAAASAVARLKGCRFRIDVRVKAGVLADEYVTATNALARDFYLHRIR